MPFSCKIGDSFYLKIDPLIPTHRYVIITSKNSEGKVVLVNFTSVNEWKECCITFYPRDDRHLFEHATTIAYGRASLVLGDGLTPYAKNNYRYCEVSVVNKIIKGALSSNELAPYLLEEIKRQYPGIC